MIRLRRPDGTVIECDTAEDLEIVNRVFSNGNAPAQPSRPIPVSPAKSTPAGTAAPTPGAASLKLLFRHPDVRRVFDVFTQNPTLDAFQLREKTGLGEKPLAQAMATFGTQIKSITGRPFDDFFLRRRAQRGKRRIKEYVRTKAGDMLIRDLQMARNSASEALTRLA